MSIATLDYTSVDLHYTCAGKGPDVLLIHGWASSGRMWTRLMDALAPFMRLWAVDLYGFGASPRPNDGAAADIDLHTDLLIEFCERHAIRSTAIIGHSMGGMLALKLALARPDLAARLVLLSPVVTGRYGVPIDLNRVILSKPGSLAMQHSRPLWELAVNAPVFFAPWYMDAEAAARTRQDFKRTSWQAAISGLTSIARENLEPHLPRITRPALVIVGQRDFTVPPQESRLAARRLPDAHLLELPRSHHHPLDEEPGRVISAVQDFLIV